MPREIITVQVGQCGNQLGQCYWDLMLQEHKANPQYTDARDAVFDTVGGGSGGSGGGGGSLKARGVCVDMEEGVLAAMLRGPLRSLFDDTFFVSDVSGAGNNFAVGHMEYGDRYVGAIADAVRLQVERCECVQAFLVMHSLSGGTGSGLGTRVLGMLEEEFPHVFRICPVVMPSEVGDVVTGPYNSCFALRELIEHADCVLPLDNDALARMADRAAGHRARPGGSSSSSASPSSSSAGAPLPRGVPDATRTFNAAAPTASGRALPFASMNALVAQMLSNLTGPMRFPGPLNMDINEVTTNLVPFPRLHLLTAALAPLSVSARSAPAGPRTVDAMISACLDREHQFVNLGEGGGDSGGDSGGTGGPSASPSVVSVAAAGRSHRSTCLATALIARGPQITVGDLTRNIDRLRARLRLPYWNADGFKTAICGVSPLGHRDSVLALTNDCAVGHKVARMHGRFMRLYSVRSHVHHYESYLAAAYFDDTAEMVQTMVDDYAYLDTAEPPEKMPRSMKDLVYF